MDPDNKSKKKASMYFRPIILLPWVILCIMLAVVAGIAIYGTSRYVETYFSNYKLPYSNNRLPYSNERLPEEVWIEKLHDSLDSLGVNVYSILIYGDQVNGGREIVVSIGERVNQDKPDPYYLVSGIHLMVMAGYPSLIVDSESPGNIELVRVNVTQESGNVYTVVVKLDAIRKLTEGVITEADYAKSWDFAGDYPEFEFPEE